MICVSIYEPEFEKCRRLAASHDFTEIRLDGTGFSEEQVSELFAGAGRSIATFRPGDASDGLRGRLLGAAIAAGAAYVDIEVDSPPSLRGDIVRLAREHGCTVIVSYHNHDGTPDEDTLDSMVRRCFDRGAGIAKIACVVREARECARLLSLYNGPYGDCGGRLIAIGMGRKGRITRVAAPVLGAPFTYASPLSGRDTAPGQIDYAALKHMLEQVT